MSRRLQPLADPKRRAESRVSLPWPSLLALMAAEGRADGGVGLHLLVRAAGFGDSPQMTVVVKKPPKKKDAPKRHPHAEFDQGSWLGGWD